MSAPATEVAARLDDLVGAVADLLSVDGAGLRLRGSDHRLRTVTRRGPQAAGAGCSVRSTAVVVAEAVVGDLDAVELPPGGWDDSRQAALRTCARLVSDLLVLAAEGRSEAVAHLADRLPDLGGCPS